MNARCYQDWTCTWLKICFCTFWKSSHDGADIPIRCASPWSYHVLWFWCTRVILSTHISWTLWPMDMGLVQCWMQQGLQFVRICKSVVTSPSDMELSAHEFNHVSRFWCKWVNLCDCISWILSSINMQLVPLDTTVIEVYKNVFKHGDIPFKFGVVSSWINYVSWFWTHW